ncbi:MAG: ATP-binding protein [Myxococcota bacterium]
MIARLPRLFVRIYAVVIAVVLAGALMAGGWGFAQRRPPVGSALERLIEAPDLVRQQFASRDAENARRRIAEQLDAEVRLYRLDDLPQNVPPPVRDRLARGEMAGPPPGAPPVLWMPAGPTQPDLAVLIRPRAPPPAPLPFIAALLLLGLAVVLVVLLRPLDRELRDLATVTQAFGHGDRSARVSVTPNAATAELGARFNAMADQIAGLLDDQRQLLLAVSHELRTPLNRLRFAAELLADEPDGAKRAAQLGDLHHDLDDLDDLVAELLTFFRLGEAPAAPAVAVSLAPLVDGLVADAVRLRPGLKASAHDVEHEVWADPTLLRRALSNAIANAARYADGRIRVSARTRGDQIVVHVYDDGPGIPTADRERVLQPFVRLDEARARDAGGTGLGLAVAHRIVTAFGGSLTIWEAPLGGARIALSVPSRAGLTEADPA